ncbi:MAG: MMPL family transporter [Pseudomonadota bacterium]
MDLLRVWFAVLACVLVTCLAGYGAKNITINADTRVFFSDRNENRAAFNELEERYTRRTGLLIALHSREGDVFREDRLDFIRELTEQAWTLPYSTRVDSITNAVNISSNAEGITIAEMIEVPDHSTADAMRTAVLGDAMLTKRLVSLDGKTTAVAVTVDYPMASSTATHEILAAAKTMISDLGARDLGLEVWYGGRVASSGAFSTAAKNDLKTLTPLSWVAIFALIGLITRSASMTFALFATVLLSLISAHGLLGWTGFQLNAATTTGATVIICIGVASLMHLLTAIQANLLVGQSKSEAIGKAVKTLRWPVSLALGSTMVGFLTLNSADAPPFRQLGNLSALGVMFCWIYGLTFLPNLLRLLPLKGQDNHQGILGLVENTADLIIRQRKTLLWAVPAGSALLMTGLFQLQIDDKLNHFFDHSFEYRNHTDNIERHLTGLDVIEFDIGTDTQDAVVTPQYFEKLQAFEDWLNANPKVVHISSINETFKRLHQHLNGGDASFHSIPDDETALAQYLLLYEMSLPFGRSLTDTITIDRSHSRMSVFVSGASTREVRELRESAEAWLSNEGNTEISGTGTGLAVMYAYLSSINVQSMIGGSIIALALVSVMLCFAFRSLKFGAFSLIPNLIPIAIAFGIWGYAKGEIGIAVAGVGVMTLGIIVDDTVHLVWRYLASRREGADPETAVRRMFEHVGPPMLVSSIVLMAGFGIVATSHFHISSSLGALAGLTVFVAFVADWLLLPPLLMAADHRLIPNDIRSRQNSFTEKISAPSLASEVAKKTA